MRQLVGVELLAIRLLGVAQNGICEMFLIITYTPWTRVKCEFLLVIILLVYKFVKN